MARNTIQRSSAEQLRRLRWLLSVLFTGMNAIGLVVFAWLIIQSDFDKGEQQLDAELRRVTSTVNRLVQYDGSGIVTAFIGQDPINVQCPQFAVLPGGSGEFPGHFSTRECVRMDRAVLANLAAQSADSGRLLSGYTRNLDGGMVRVGVEPFRNTSGQTLGAVVAVSNAEPTKSAHDRFILLVVGACVLLVGGLGVAGYALAWRALRPAAAALEQQEKLLAETAHDLRTPVAALRALAETALRNPEQRPELLPRTVRLASRMGSIIDGLLVRARLAAGVEQLAIQPVWLDQLVAGVVEDTPSDGASVTLTAAPCKVLVDPSLAQRAVTNLLENALKYGRQPDQQAIVHISVAGGRVTVADHGPGIAAEAAGALFERFQTTSGTGLGLSVVRWVAEAHGGSLAVYNAEDAGAIFELTLPVVQ